MRLGKFWWSSMLGRRWALMDSRLNSIDAPGTSCFSQCWICSRRHLTAATFPPELGLATIVVLHKPGRSPTDCSSYRPISLINSEVKLYAKIVANRLIALYRFCMCKEKHIPNSVAFCPDAAPVTALGGPMLHLLGLGPSGTLCTDVG